MEGGSKAWKKGDKCFALYAADELWYPAVVSRVGAGGEEFDVEYDDFEGDDKYDYCKGPDELAPPEEFAEGSTSIRRQSMGYAVGSGSGV